ncbi:DUF6452 family protein [Croceitalea sp. MTPC9]|uniref:DUF6452 family protein n=1 Tax=unclassified Croceitalea TaxID=2632280 RepID=UPI002B3FEA90|nr:DUF6452 family protein [Croceitalea sp. MTPC6]GMN16303.1 DUF6452 family protein [Croceitalea sp. MTPC9]
MKRIPIVLLILVLIINFSSCEKDDICIDGDTPLLIVGFYDASSEDTTVFKSVPNLRIKAIDNNSIFSSDIFSDRSTVADSVLIPLRIDGVSTSYEFIINSVDDATTMEETGNIDTLGFSYTLGEEFISRACGFVANYNELDTIRTISNEDWIRRVSIVEKNITNNSTTINVKIFH